MSQLTFHIAGAAASFSAILVGSLIGFGWRHRHHGASRSRLWCRYSLRNGCGSLLRNCHVLRSWSSVLARWDLQFTHRDFFMHGHDGLRGDWSGVCRCSEPKSSLHDFWCRVGWHRIFVDPKKSENTLLPQDSDPLARRLRLPGEYPTPDEVVRYSVASLVARFLKMDVAGLLSGLLGIGSRAVKVAAMDQFMRMLRKVTTATA